MQIVIVSPVLADANNGNWRTAQRWQRLLRPLGQIRIVTRWPDGPQAGRDTVMLALHARKSAESIAAWHATRGAQGLGVVLTGTDLHHDIHDDPAALASLVKARKLVVLHACGIAALPVPYRDKAVVVLQSARPRQTRPKTKQHLNVVAIGHLRHEKSPETLFAAARLLRDMPAIRLTHIGQALDPALAEQARTTMLATPSYRWLGGLPHEKVRRILQRAHLLVHPSRLEGGANVVIEAIMSGTAVLASAVPGNIGLLGEDYPGYFPWGDAAALADGLRALRQDQTASGVLLARLNEAITARQSSFHPSREAAALATLVRQLADT